MTGPPTRPEPGAGNPEGTREIVTEPAGPAGPTDATEPVRGTVLAGRYELRGLLGTGGMSRVYLAHDRELDRPVAVKLLPNDPADADGLARLRDEARAAAAVEHPGVVTVHDVGATPSGTYVVMTFVEGETLAARLDRDGTLPVADVVAVGRAVCDALGAAHRAGVVHRDVTPGNIMLRPDGGVTVTDFGIARVGDGAGRTRTGYIVGTPAYLAPEQCDGTGRLDGRADLYALACCLFTALTGRPPFTDPDPFAVVLAHLRATPPRPSSLRADVPRALDEHLVRALSKDPSRRPADADAFAAGLADATGTRPVRTRDLPGPAATTPVGAGSAGTRALDDTLAEVDGDDGRSADRRRGAGVALIVVAAVIVIALLVVAVALDLL